MHTQHPDCKKYPDFCVRSVFPQQECKRYPKWFCDRSIYELPGSGLKITLPTFTKAELKNMYATSYSGQAALNVTSPRPIEQAQFIKEYASGISSKTGLHVVEMGCAGGFALYNVRKLATQGGHIECFEVDQDYHRIVKQTFAGTEREGIKFTLRPQLFDGDALEPNSVDLFMSSHVAEHLTDPCAWMAGLMRVLKPGGYVFSEVPDQYMDPDKEMRRGQFHLLFFSKDSFAKLMTDFGFEIGYVADVGGVVRSVLRKPLV